MLQETLSLEDRMRIIQEIVQGKQITLAHIIANPDEKLYEQIDFAVLPTITKGSIVYTYYFNRSDIKKREKFMKNNSQTRLYNLIFPIWILWLIPLAWVVVLPANFIIDSLVVLLTLKCLKIKDKKTIYRKTILKVWGFGFLSDFIGTAVMLIPILIDSNLSMDTPIGRWWYENLTNSVSYNPLENIFAILWVSLAVLVAAWFIYLFNYKVSFKKLEIENSMKKKLALSLAVFTAPYLFYLPTAWFF